MFSPTIVWRHRRENLKKCSLRGLESRNDFLFYKYPGMLPALNNYILLHIDAPELTVDDANLGLFIVDATWNYAEKMCNALNKNNTFVYRSIPKHFVTAYPRRQEDCKDPDRGLASIEAIYIAYAILKRDTQGLLDQYHWKDQFLTKNAL